MKEATISCDSEVRAHCFDIPVLDPCNPLVRSLFGISYTNDTELKRIMFVAGSNTFSVKEIARLFSKLISCHSAVLIDVAAMATRMIAEMAVILIIFAIQSKSHRRLFENSNHINFFRVESQRTSSQRTLGRDCLALLWTSRNGIMGAQATELFRAVPDTLTLPLNLPEPSGTSILVILTLLGWHNGQGDS
jgi:hypothetical protein